VFDYRTREVTSETPRNDEGLSPNQYFPLVHSSMPSSSQYYENDEYGYRDDRPASGHVNELTYTLAETSIGGSTASAEYLQREQSPSVENSSSSFGNTGKS